MVVKTEVKTKALAHYLVSRHSYEQTAIVAAVWALEERKVMVPSSSTALISYKEVARAAY